MSLARVAQTGDLTVGNRLVDPSERTVQASALRHNSLVSGHRACQGCGQALGARYALDAAFRASGGNLVVVNATGCLEVFTTAYPESAWKVPWLHSVFANASSVASGVAAALRVKGRPEIRVVAQGGDGGTTDIGMGSLSGMFDRNDDVLYLCYDNGAYMNTGVQRSSATPPGARTSTTPAVGPDPGNPFGTGKSVPRIAMAHGIPYVATASVGNLHDLEAKVERAIGIRGSRYIQIDVPCPLGWGMDGSLTIEVARNAIRCGLFPLFEAEHGRVTRTTPIRGLIAVEAYLQHQGRFSHLLNGSPEGAAGVAALQRIADDHIREYDLVAGAKP